MAVANRQQQKAERPETTIEFCGAVFTPLCSGAMYWAEHQTLLVADLHLEKMSSFAKGGQFFPPYDTGATLKRLAADIEHSGAQRVIALGDSFHRDEGTTTLSLNDVDAVSAMTIKVDWIWIAGNHDPSEHELGGSCCESVAMDGIILSHEPDPKVKSQIAGHLHPSARVAINGRSTRSACFVYDKVRMIMPAYGVSTGSLNVLKDVFQPVIKRSEMAVAVLGKDKVYPVSPKHLVHR